VWCRLLRSILRRRVAERAGARPPCAPRSAQRPLRHVGIIMDGNGGWAEQRGPRLEGTAGLDSVRDGDSRSAQARASGAHPVTPSPRRNWQRPARPRSGLMDLLRDYLNRERPETHGQRHPAARHRRAGPVAGAGPRPARGASPRQRRELRNGAHPGAGYGGRGGDRRHGPQVAEDAGRGALQAGPSSTPSGRGRLWTRAAAAGAGVRTSGEMRVSNFLLWQLAYAGIPLTEDLWPDSARRRCSSPWTTSRTAERPLRKTSAQNPPAPLTDDPASTATRSCAF